MFKKWDIIVIVLLIVISFIPEVTFGIIMGRKYEGTYAEITVGGKLYKKILLSEHSGEEKLDINTNYGYNIVEIKDQSIRIIEADCPDVICVKGGWISKPGQNIVCIPHKVMVEVKGINKSEEDIIRAN